MKINLDRLSQLAGIRNTGGNLNESATYEGSAIDGLEEVMDEEEHSKLDEVIEIDEVMLVQELRRAKKLMEAKKKSTCWV